MAAQYNLSVNVVAISVYLKSSFEVLFVIKQNVMEIM